MEPGSNEELKRERDLGMGNPKRATDLEKSTSISISQETSRNFQNYLIIEDSENVDTLIGSGKNQIETIESSSSYEIPRIYESRVNPDPYVESKIAREEDHDKKGSDDDKGSGGGTNKMLANVIEPGKSAKVIEAEPESPEIPTNIRILEIYHSIYDTSQSFKIHKYLIKEEALKEIKESCPEELKLIGIYGISSVMKQFLSLIFEEQITLFPQKEGLYLFYNPVSALGVFAFITPNEEMYTKSPIESSNRFVVIIRILTDLCTKIIACISEDIIEKWFYEDNGTLNPFKPKIHQSGGASVRNVTVQESKLEKVNVINSNSNSHYAHSSYYMHNQKKEIFSLPNDNLNFLFIHEFESISANEKSLTSRHLSDFPNELFKLNDINSFSLKVNSLYDKMKIRSFDSYRINQDLRGYFERMLQEKGNP